MLLKLAIADAYGAGFEYAEEMIVDNVFRVNTLNIRVFDSSLVAIPLLLVLLPAKFP
ncbi:MAG: hypothetical protein V7K18_15720 [Nostoc sp.]|uniref:hypothetical protein n=1 Tax=Nostoc sp. TaxID=1180 RepID=UPI002FF8A7B2